MITRTCTWAIVMVLAAGASSCAADSDIDCGSYEFSAREWREAGQRVERGEEGDALKARRRGADALVECRLLRNKTKKQVRKMLSAPSMRSREENAWFYLIGEERGLPLDDEVLAVKFRRNRVARVTTEVW